MNTIKIVAITLIVAGVLGLVYGSFSYTKETTASNSGRSNSREGKGDHQRPGVGGCRGHRGRRAPSRFRRQEGVGLEFRWRCNDRGAIPEPDNRRLILREIVLTDAPALFEINADADAMKWFGSAFTEMGQAQALVETFAEWRRLPNPGTRWGIVRAGDGAFLGTCGLFGWNRRARSCVAGFELAARPGAGAYMAEALGRGHCLGLRVHATQSNRRAGASGQRRFPAAPRQAGIPARGPAEGSRALE